MYTAELVRGTVVIIQRVLNHINILKGFTKLSQQSILINFLVLRILMICVTSVNITKQMSLI